MTDHGDNGYLAARLTQLFKEKRRQDGKPYTLQEVADGVNALADQELLSMQYLSQLRLGQRRNPSYQRMVAIARWFGVETDYFSTFKPGGGGPSGT